jgi:transcriptional regulator with XRE-family HTH domain
MVEDIGAVLRAARARFGYSLKEVEMRSQALSQTWQKPAYKVSASWLDRVEKENRDLSAVKLIVLASIYGLTVDQVLAYCPSTTEGLARIGENGPNATLLLHPGPLEEQAKSLLPERFATDPPPEHTALLEMPKPIVPSRYRHGVIGLKDRALDPMVRAGSVVLVDTEKQAVVRRKGWNSEFDRPIYFLLTRTGYFSGFCELDKTSEWLTLVPHPLSPETSQRWRFLKEVEVVGTVTAVLSKRAA